MREHYINYCIYIISLQARIIFFILGSNSASSLSRSSSSSSSSSSSPTSERDALIDSLLDKYDGKNYFGESVETAEEATKSSEKLRKQVGLREGEELPGEMFIHFPFKIATHLSLE